MLNKFLSFLFPITILNQNSLISKALEINMMNGKLVLDSKNTNYSYGNLQRILRSGLKAIGFKRIQAMDSILVLGVAGGSVIRTLADEIKFNGKITGVDVDKKVIELANTYFQLNEIPNTEIIIEDAFEFVLKSKEKYDLIIIDIFKDTKMPNFLFETYFIERICCILNSKGFILFNTMILNDEQIKINLKYKSNFSTVKYFISSITPLEKTNDLILIERK